MDQLACIRRLGLAPEPSGGAQDMFSVVQDVFLLSLIGQRRALGGERATSLLEVSRGVKSRTYTTMRRMILEWSHAADECETSGKR